MGWLLIPFFVMMASGIAIAFCLVFAALVFIVMWGAVPLSTIPRSLYGGIDSFYLLAIPFFVLAGQLMNKSDITSRLVRFSDLVVGKIAGGLAQVNILVSIIFAGLTGSGVADTSAVGSILIPAMTKQGFKPEYSAAVTAASSIIGPIIPPSVLMIIYANIMGMSVGSLFAAGFAPGLGIGLGLMILSYFFAIKQNHPRRVTTYTAREAALLTKDAILALIMPIIIIGGIVGGVFTPTEAAAVAVAYALIVGFVIFRTLKLSDLPECFLQSARVSSIILLIISCAAAFGWALTVIRVPSILARSIFSITTNKYVILLMINVFLLFMGMIMETGANCIILAPILAPMAIRAGVDPLHFAIIMIVNLNIGLATPPLGVCLFVAAPLAKVSLEQLSKAISPFLAVNIVVLLILTYWEGFALFVPRLLLGYGM